MAQEQLSNLSTVELKKKVKTLRVAVIFIGLCVAVMVISGVIISIKKGFSALSVTFLGFLPLVLIFFIQLKQANAELKKRDE